jgi:hypothetical protein
LVKPLAALAGACAMASSALAQGTLPPNGVLSLTLSRTFVQWGGLGLGQNFQADPWLASASASNANVGVAASADLAAGKLRGIAQDANNGSGIVAYAYAGFDLNFQNTGGAAISFAAGAVSATIDASFLRSLGGDAAGYTASVVSGSLGAEGGGLRGSAGFSLSAVDANRPNYPELRFQTTASPGFLATGSADMSSLMVTLALPAFTLAPQENLRLLFGLNPYAHGYSPADVFAATTDAFNTASLAMRLPAGTQVNSAQALAWVSVVPEPGAWASMLLGLAGIVAVARRRIAPSAASPSSSTAQLDGSGTATASRPSV